MSPWLRVRGGLVGAVLALTFTVTWLMVQVPTLKDDADASSSTANRALTKVAEVEGQVKANAKALDEANRRLVALGKTPVPVPKVEPSQPPVQPEGLTGVQSAAVRAIVSDQISRQKVTVTQAEVSQIARIAALMIPKPADGKTPTAAEIKPQVTAAIAAYCTADKCVGKPGVDGKPGADGADGAPGADAPKVTDAELLSAAQQALSAYCAARKECSGADGLKGDKGDQGLRGESGRGITSGPTCIGTGMNSYWLTKYSDDTEQRQDGPCRLGVEISTDPPPN